MGNEIMRNILSYFQNPPPPHRVCTCGIQRDGTLVPECRNCQHWRFANQDDSGWHRPPANRVDHIAKLAEHYQALTLAEKHLANLRSILRHGDMANAAQKAGLVRDIRSQQQMVKRLQNRIRRGELMRDRQTATMDVA